MSIIQAWRGFSIILEVKRPDGVWSQSDQNKSRSRVQGTFCFLCVAPCFSYMYMKPFAIKKFFIKGLPNKSIIMFKFAV